VSDYTSPPRQSYWVQPEERPGPAPGFAYAGFWIRLVAFLLDLVPLLIVSLIVVLPAINEMFAAFRDIPLPPRGTPIDSPEYQAWQLALQQRMSATMTQFYPAWGALQLLQIAYYVGFWTWRGQTPAMMLLGLRVARESDGAPPGLARSILRFIGYIISEIPLFLGFIWVAFDSRKQGWHDKIAGTVVVRRTA
jgi:uncharacterized RDD family membrane protein YckC